MASLRVIEGGLPSKRQVVLVVDDEPMIRLSLAIHLDDNGFEVREADSADAAIAMLHEPNCGIDLVFSDVRMPGERDGLSLARWVFENRPNIPVILASGDMGKQIAISDLCGAETMAKPYGYDTALKKIRSTLKNKAEKEGFAGVAVPNG